MNRIEVAQAAWQHYGDCQLDNWELGDGYVSATGIPKRAKQEYLHVFVFGLGPKPHQTTLKSILRVPWHQRVRFDGETGMPTIPRHLFKLFTWNYNVWGGNYVAERAA